MQKTHQRCIFWTTLLVFSLLFCNFTIQIEADSDLPNLALTASKEGRGVRLSVPGTDITKMRASVYSLHGELLFQSPMVRGNSVYWSQTNKKGERMASGIYLFRVVVKKNGRTLRSKVNKLLLTPQRAMAGTKSDPASSSFSETNKTNSATNITVPKEFKTAPSHSFSDWRYWTTREPTKGEIEAAIQNHVRNAVDRKFVFKENERVTINRNSYLERVKENIEHKIKIATPPMVSRFVYFNKVDAHIKHKIDYGKLKSIFKRGEISKAKIQSEYRQTLKNLNIDLKEILKHAFDKSWIRERGSKTNLDTSASSNITIKSGAHHTQLDQNRPGTAMYTSGESSSSGSSWGHSAIWSKEGDPSPNDPESRIAMASWDSEPDAQEPLHERKGVGYDYRRVWAQEGSTYGLKVVDSWGNPALDSEAQDASDYAESLHGKPWGGYLFGNRKGTDNYYCSKVVWQSWWAEEDYDLDGGGFWAWWVVIPDEIYIDDNTEVMYSY